MVTTNISLFEVSNGGFIQITFKISIVQENTDVTDNASNWSILLMEEALWIKQHTFIWLIFLPLSSLNLVVVVGMMSLAFY